MDPPGKVGNLVSRRFYGVQVLTCIEGLPATLMGEQVKASPALFLGCPGACATGQGNTWLICD